MPSAIDITNKPFGDLIALTRAPNKGKKTYWLCECKCGNKKEIQTSHLTGGLITSCGCSRSNKSGNKHNDTIVFDIEQECILCNRKFVSNNHMRKYCYNCSPAGLKPKDAIRHKTRQLKHLLVQYKGGCCQICGYNKCEGALQFHHLNPQEKDFTISKVNLNETVFSIGNLYLEVDKCLLLCANCHAEKHYK